MIARVCSDPLHRESRTTVQSRTNCQIRPLLRAALAIRLAALAARLDYRINTLIYNLLF